MKILIDSNVALDLLLERDAFYDPALRVFSLSKGGLGLFVSASAITDIYSLVWFNTPRLARTEMSE